WWAGRAENADQYRLSTVGRPGQGVRREKQVRATGPAAPGQPACGVQHAYSPETPMDTENRIAEAHARPDIKACSPEPPSIACMLDPRSVAILGASDDTGR